MPRTVSRGSVSSDGYTRGTQWVIRKLSKSIADDNSPAWTEVAHEAWLEAHNSLHQIFERSFLWGVRDCLDDLKDIRDHLADDKLLAFDRERPFIASYFDLPTPWSILAVAAELDRVKA